MNDRSLKAVRECRDDLEDLAESDLPADWIAQTLLDVVDDADANG